jgi:dTDP-4-dehydrorhamnose reductase
MDDPHGGRLALMNAITDQTAIRAPLRIGVIGAGGQLGRSLVREINASSGADLAFAATRADLDLTMLDDLDAWLDATLGKSGAWPLDAVVNAAAHTKVDACETEPELAYQVNALAPAAFAEALMERDVRFLHVSTDYVFSGDQSRPYREDDPTDPRTVYGKTKRAGEITVLGIHASALVVRTSWVFGPGQNFVGAILGQAEARRRGETAGPLRVVDDQVGAPTSAVDLAAALVEICTNSAPDLRGAKGLLNLRNSGETTWYGFAERILELAGYDDVAIEPVETSAFKTVAPRPAYSVLDTSLARDLGIEFRPWFEALESYLGEIGQLPAAPGQRTRNGVPR